MGLHPDEVSMLRESLPEYLRLAEMGLGTTKPGGGVLGYPTTALLMAVVDALGSFVRGHSTFRVKIDSVDRVVEKASDHIFILNSDFFGFHFSEAQLRDIYGLCRSPLTHNAVVGRGHMLVPGDPSAPAFEFRDGVVETNLAGLLKACRTAVTVFLGVADSVVATSKAVRELREKAARAELLREGVPGTTAPSASASAMGRKP